MIMKIEYSFYTLTYQTHFRSGQREGSLLRVTFDDGLQGYADCHPWTELGDLPLADQLRELQLGSGTSLTHRSLHFARIDAEARVKKKHVLEGCVVPKSHFLLPQLNAGSILFVDRALEQGFTHLKIKVHSDSSTDRKCLIELLQYVSRTSLKVRLDFNEKFTAGQFQQFAQQIAPWKRWIDFCEDPFPFAPRAWQTIQWDDWSLACDAKAEVAISHPEAADVWVIKPAIQSETPFLTPNRKRIVVTSYLDHPIGQVAAAYVAAQVPADVCGLLSHRIYQPTPFSAFLSWHGPEFQIPPGTGFGFDELLLEQPWRPLL